MLTESRCEMREHGKKWFADVSNSLERKSNFSNASLKKKARLKENILMRQSFACFVCFSQKERGRDIQRGTPLLISSHFLGLLWPAATGEHLIGTNGLLTRVPQFGSCPT